MDFTLPDADGKDISLASYKGKYVLVDFWASWCGPCRAENPNVVKAYSRFKEKGFEILGVSLDDKKDKWQAAVQADNLAWTHVSDLKGWKNAVAEQYGIRAIPQNLLLDPQGVIIAKNLRGDALEKKLEEVLK
jgi:peroxiredoxin